MKRFFILLSILFYTSVFAQTETTEWWVNGSVYATTSCETGGNISVPTNPSKKGYTFQGWETAVYDMSTLDTSINGTSSIGQGKKIRITFSYGYVYAEYLCSKTPGSNNTTWYPNNGEIDTTFGAYCWCRVTEFVPINDTKIYETKSSHWVFNGDRNAGSGCNYNCSVACPESIKNSSDFRISLFGTNQ